MATQYQYTSLKPREIRLVQFKQQDVIGVILCQFRTVNIDELPVSYTAISYCWGSSDRVAELSFSNGQTLRITRSVEEIVHWLADKEGYFWVDFLCINQDDLDEKGTQVAFMSVIFSHSERVAAWLGKEIEDGEAAFDKLSRWQSAYGALTYSDLEDVPEWDQSFPVEIEKLKGLLRNPWFRRAWVVQEVVTAPGIPDSSCPWDPSLHNLVLHIGQISMPWPDLEFLVRLLWAQESQKDDLEADDLVTRVRYNIYSIHRLRSRYTFDMLPDLGTGLLDFLCFESSDPRDRIYAIVNICRNLGEDAFQPDYKAPVSHVYNRTAYDLLTKHYLFHILITAGVGHVRSDENLASWAPDWTQGKLLMGGPMILSQRFGASGYIASYDTPYIRGDWRLKRLTFLGIQIDTYGRQFIFPQPSTLPRGRLASMIGPSARPWMKEIMKFLDESVHHNGLRKELKPLVFARTIMADHEMIGPDHRSSIIQLINFWLDDNDRWDTEGGAPVRGVIPRMSKWEYLFIDDLPRQNLLAYMELFGTQQRGLLGLGPKGVQEGDVLCILMGLRLPCLLRPVDVRKGKVTKWLFVGVCYVDGLMAGEGLKMGSTQEFTII
ncbi:MAG: hypothetical protein LQ350_004258 [Teloschistes chrysophthalmus]|nr:MAG: hypothetical protein LQ350_004258 [Niorma chrysophthalma]